MTGGWLECSGIGVPGDRVTIGIHGEPNTEGSGVDWRGVVHEGTKAHRVRCGIYRRIQVAHFDPTMIDFLL